jgi:hypothetical protein
MPDNHTQTMEEVPGFHGLLIIIRLYNRLKDVIMVACAMLCAYQKLSKFLAFRGFGCFSLCWPPIICKPLNITLYQFAQT